MEYVLLIAGLICMILGIVGSFAPVLPGAPLSWIGLLLLYLTKSVPMDWWTLGITLGITIFISVLEYVIPAQGTKKFGGSKYGVWGTNIGLIVGLLAPVPFGFILGPFIGAYLGELYFDAHDQKRALKAATGSFIGFLASTFISFVVCTAFLGLFLIKVWQFRHIWF
ncbi:DUF456 domain-containing protein [Flavobacterium sp. '19STA2R22 D10 B1']|uniref:DUF456 domain-containing protein n=1 Tax=Flavobacterium aerium TaxID=3037261 RepID=UPI00278C4FCC|nr:DUF456 domain-containing protein [Flavobacterium sp. '19STA2R22 D10 B1']